ncbi:MAG: autotransporter domain-containing protein [bacterium]|nr:autotransporter domain-containing protein [bacterium]
MKKIIGFVLVFLLAASLPMLAKDGKKQRNYFVNGGYATSDVDVCFVDLGIEKQTSGNFYWQFLFELYFKPFGEQGDFDSDGLGLNLYGVYKFPVSEKTNFFAKAGVCYSMVNVAKNIEEVTYGDQTVLEADWVATGIGAGFGGGIEHRISKRFSLLAGATCKLFFKSDPVKWVKMYCGISYGKR